MTQPHSSQLRPTEKIWHNGAFVAWDDARVHVLSHVISYGTALFEGIRCYDTPAGPAVFCLGAHMRRLLDSAKIYRIDVPYSTDQISEAALELVGVNQMDACYIRPIVLRGYGAMGVSSVRNPVEVFLACWQWGAYLEGAQDGVDVCVSSWRRMAPNTLPVLAKAAGNYMNSQLIRMEAAANGYDEGIALDTSGFVSEGSGENVFIIRDGLLMTPPLGCAVLEGITRAAVLQLARDLGIEIRQAPIPRELLYIADEAFLTGTAAEITPIRSVDRIRIGTGCPGPVTRTLKERFFAIVAGEAPDQHGWLTPAREPMEAR